MSISTCCEGSKTDRADTRFGDPRRERWDAVAKGWAARLAWIERDFEPLTAWFRQQANDRRHILDVACGAGYPTLAIAPLSGCRVVAADLSGRMVGVAAQGARARRLNDIAFVQTDADALPFVDGAFDLVTNAFGLMFVSDPLRALSESYRVLMSGAHVAIATWDQPSKSPFFTVIREVSARLGRRPGQDSERQSAPRVDSSPRLDSADRLDWLLREAGFSAISVESLSMTFEFESALEYAHVFTDLAWKSPLHALSTREIELFNDAVTTAVRPYSDQGRVRLVATSLHASGRK